MAALIQNPNSLSNRELRQADDALRLRPLQLHPLGVDQRRNLQRLLLRGSASEVLLLVPASPPPAMQAYDVANGGVEGQSADQGADEDDEDQGGVCLEILGVGVRPPGAFLGVAVGGRHRRRMRRRRECGGDDRRR